MDKPFTISLVFGTRPEIIKLSPVFTALRERSSLRPSCLFTGQQKDIAPAFITEFGIPVAHCVEVMHGEQTLPELLALLFSEIGKVFANDRPDLVIVQGDTCSALAGAMVAHMLMIPVVHVEAGLRTGNRFSPFPEETNRVLISKLATLHCAATQGNNDNLLREGIEAQSITVTGNPIVEVVNTFCSESCESEIISSILSRLQNKKLIVMTAHRRENFDQLMDSYFLTLKEFLNEHPSYCVVIPVHPNPNAKLIINRHFSEHPQVHTISPLGYKDFLSLLTKAELVVSDSGGIQEEVASLNRPLIILREFTERPEAIAHGISHLATDAHALKDHLTRFVAGELFHQAESAPINPFGDGQASQRIADLVEDYLVRESVN